MFSRIKAEKYTFFTKIANLDGVNKREAITALWLTKYELGMDCNLGV